MKKLKRATACLFLALVMISLCAVTVFAEETTETTPAAVDEFVGVIVNTWNTIKGGIKTICSYVVFPAAIGILGIWFVVECSTCYAAYKKNRSFSLFGPIILGISLAVVATLAVYIWTAVGW